MKRPPARSAFLAPPVLVSFAFCSIAVLLALLAFALYPGGTASAAQGQQNLPRASQLRQLSLADRVAYQRAIEEVYWRHRIWPKERPDPKPSLDQVMPPAQLEQKVGDYLRSSQALEDYWQQPVTPEQLQAEMERMAQHTQQPEVLRELFAALGNDPFVITECLARPTLSERLMTNRLKLATIGWHNEPFESWRARAEKQVPKVVAARAVDYTLPAISETVNGFAEDTRTATSITGAPTPTPGCTDDSWTASNTINAPTARYGHTAVWTGSEMIVWGGSHGGSSALNIGVRYNPATDSWTAISNTNAPTAREGHTAVWTGTEMVVWGGAFFDDGTNYYLNTGGRYNPGTDSWTATSTTSAPTGRYHSTAVWTGSEMVVWSGYNSGIHLNTGGRYNPGTDSWTATSTTNAPSGRYLSTAVWTGSEMVVWGGFNGITTMNTGGRYNPGTDSWTATSTTNAPTGRETHTAVWTGGEMIVWGGYNGITRVNTGWRYNPGTDSWTATSTTNAPSARSGHTAVWTGSEMIVWGGGNSSGTYLNTGGRYNPGSNGWTATNTTNAPTGRENHTAVWTGSEMIVWGGDNGLITVNTGGRYCAQPPTPTEGTQISGNSFYCNPAPDTNPPVNGVLMSLTGSAFDSTTTSGNGDYSFFGLSLGGSYTVTPTKAARAPGSAGINTVDVIATQRHFLGITLLTGCRLTAADVDGFGGINTVDVTAIQRFVLGRSTGIANVGKYKFTPASRSYSPLTSTQTGQNFDTVVFGDVASPFAH